MTSWSPFSFLSSALKPPQTLSVHFCFNTTESTRESFSGSFEHVSPQSSANTSTRSWIDVSPIKSPVTRLTTSPSPTRSVSGSSPLSYSISGMADRIGIVARFENAIVIEEKPTGLRALFSHIPKSVQTVKLRNFDNHLVAGANAATVQTLIVDPALKVRIDISVSSVFGEACSRIDHVELDPNDLKGKNNVTIIVDPQCVIDKVAPVATYTYDKMYY